MSEGARLVATMVTLSLWVGAGLLFVAVVAPAAFAVLPTRTLAGLLVGRVLPVLFVSGIVVGAVVAALAARGGPFAGWRIGGGLVVAAACAVAHFWIGGRIARLRADLGGALESLPAGDPQRALFGQLHGLSVAGLGLAGLAAAATLVLAAIALRTRG
ncbi:MAG TPA: DUF4149 domain-containing protein [Gemmatimonadaceae bacterium]